MASILEQHRDQFFKTTIDLHAQSATDIYQSDDPLGFEQGDSDELFPNTNSDFALNRIKTQIIHKLEATLGRNPPVSTLPLHHASVAADFPFDEEEMIRNAFDSLIYSMIDNVAEQFLRTLSSEDRRVVVEESEHAGADTVAYYIADYFFPDLAKG